MGGMKALAPEEHSTAPMIPPVEDERGEEEENVYAGLEIYEEYQ